MNEAIKKLKFDSSGLIPAIAQNAETGEVLMLAWMNAEALEKTIATGEAHYWSRSRAKLWRKGETSGNVQKVKEVRADCDKDVLLLKIEQIGGACHLGYRSCFLWVLKEGTWTEDGIKVFDPEERYRKK